VEAGVTRLIVGVDPGTHTGFAIYDGEKFRCVETMTHCAAVVHLQIMAEARSVALVVYEDARLRTWFGAKGKEALQGAGSIKRDCSIWAEWLALWGVPYLAVSPQSKGAKLNAEQFRRLTGWEGRTSEHARDAAMLVFKRKVPT
jgi:hypothetical protein